MNTALDNVSHRIQRSAVSVVVDRVIEKIGKEQGEGLADLVDIAQQFWGNDYPEEFYEKMRAAVRDPGNRWVRYINDIIANSDRHVLKTMAMNLGFESFIRGTKQIRENRKKYDCNIPWLILFDPTTACNMHCIGCWSGTYGHKFNLTFDEMDSIVTQGKELGVYFYMLTGGEPLVRKKDVLALARKHNDAEFGIYTNSTLIDDDFCKEVRELGNITFFLSIEGSPDTNDARRGEGHYYAAIRAMDLLRKYGIIFGTSICYTRDNIYEVTSDEFLRLIADKGARFGFYFHYMPVGMSAVPELMPTAEQREYMVNRIRQLRSSESDILFYPMDFQNDGQYVGGCIAGGRNYFHINSAGEAEPCVFIHYSDSNIREKTILEMLQSPLFKAFHEGQPFNRNHLRPCPMLENPAILQRIVNETGAHNTDMDAPESVEHLCGKCIEYAKNWAPVADEIWSRQDKKMPHYTNYKQD